MKPFILKLNNFSLGIEQQINQLDEQYKNQLYSDDFFCRFQHRFYRKNVTTDEYWESYKNWLLLSEEDQLSHPFAKEFGFSSIKQDLDDNIKRFNFKSFDDVAIMRAYDIKDTQEDNNLINMLPDFIKNEVIKLDYFIVSQGKFIRIHRDTLKPCTLFYLLSDPIAETKWWNLKTDSKHLFYTKERNTISQDNLEFAHSEVIESKQWYLFDNDSYHSVHPSISFDDAPRRIFQVEFRKLKYYQVVELLKQHAPESLCTTI